MGFAVAPPPSARWRLELGGAAGASILAGEAIEHGIEQVQGPGAIEEMLGGRAVGGLAEVTSVGGLAEVTSLGVARVDGEHGLAAAALRGLGARALVGQEEAAISAEEGAEAAPAMVGGGEGAFF